MGRYMRVRQADPVLRWANVVRATDASCLVALTPIGMASSEMHSTMSEPHRSGLPGWNVHEPHRRSIERASGRKGGHRLRREPVAITLAQVLEGGERTSRQPSLDDACRRLLRSGT